MIRMLTKLEEIKQTQRQHAALLQSILRQMNVLGGQGQSELPESMKFPMETPADVDSVENMLRDSSTKHVLVCEFW